MFIFFSELVHNSPRVYQSVRGAREDIPSRSGGGKERRHMKSLIVLAVGLLAVGCLTTEEKQKALRDSVVGEYEWKHEGNTTKQVFLDNGKAEIYINGHKEEEVQKWSLVENEIHIEYFNIVSVYGINPDNSITHIADIRGGKRTRYTKEYQQTSTYKKIK